MILFFVAISAGWWHSGDLMSWITTGIATFAVSGLVGWCIWTTRDRTKYWWFQADPDQVSFVNNGPEGEARDGRVSRYLLLTKGITHVVHALFHKPNGSCSVGGSNLSVQDFEMSPWPTGESSDVPDEGTRAYQQHGDANCANRSPLIINVQKPTLPFDVSILPPMSHRNGRRYNLPGGTVHLFHSSSINAFRNFLLFIGVSCKAHSS